MATRTEIKNLITNYITTNGNKNITGAQVRELFNLIADYYRHQDDAINVGFVPENVANKSTNTALGTSNTLYPSQNAVKVYADTKEPSVNKATDFSVVNNVKFPTTQAVSTEIALRIAQLVDSAPLTLDTLNELANALGDDPNFATTITTALGLRELLSNKVASITNGNHTSTDYYTSVKAVFDFVNNGFLSLGNTGQLGDIVENALPIGYYDLQDVDALGLSDASNSGDIYKLTLQNLRLWLKNYLETLDNKVTNFNTFDNTTYPTTLAVLNHVNDQIAQKLTSLSNFFLYDTASDISGYKNLKATPWTGFSATPYTITTDGQTLVTYATESGVPNVTYLPSGFIGLHLHGEQASGTKNVQLYAEIVIRQSGGSESVLTTTSYSENLDTFFWGASILTDGQLSAPVVINSTDRILIRIKAHLVGTGSDPVIYLRNGYDVPNSYYSRLTLPVSSVSTTLGYTPENIANKSTNTALGTSDTLYPSQKAVKTYVDNQITTNVGSNPNNALLFNIFMSNNF